MVINDIVLRDEKVYEAVSRSIEDIEKIVEGKVYYGRCAGSRVQGLCSSASDEDIHLFVDASEQYKAEAAKEFGLSSIGGGKVWDYMVTLNDGERVPFDLDLVFRDEIEKKNAVYKDEIKKYPTVYHRTAEEQERMNRAYPTLRAREDYSLWMQQLLFLNDTVWVKDEEGYCQYLEALKDRFVIDFLDGFFCRILGNWNNCINNKEEVLVRKYLYTVFHIEMSCWILKKNTKPPMNFLELISTVEIDKSVCDEILKYYYLNSNATIYKTKYFEPKSDILNEYIIQMIEYLCQNIRLYSKTFSAYDLVFTNSKAKQLIYMGNEFGWRRD